MAGSDPSIVKTTWPEPLTVPLPNDAPSFVTVYGMPAAFPPIVHVIVWDDSLEVWVQAYEEPRDHSLNPAMVIKAVVSLFVTVRSVTFTDPSAIVPLTVRLLNTMRWLVIVSTFALVTVRESAVRSDPRATVPAIVSVANRWPAPRLMEPPERLTTTVEVPVANAPPAVLSERIVRMLAFAVSAPPMSTVRAFAIIGRLAPEVVNVVVPGPPWIVTVCATRPSEAIVKVVVEEPLSNSIVLNSLPGKLAPANVMI